MFSKIWFILDNNSFLILRNAFNMPRALPTNIRLDQKGLLHSSLQGKSVSYEQNEVLWIWSKSTLGKTTAGKAMGRLL